MDKKQYAPRSAREIAVLSLSRMEREGKYSNLEADAAIKKFSLEGAERALYTKLFYGVTERMLTLDHHIKLFSKRDPASLSVNMRNILRVSLYQILYLDRIPDSAAVNEGVELAKKYERQSAASFANAVLRRACKEGESLPERKEGDIGYLSLKYSVAEDICRLYVERLGYDEAERLLLSLLSAEYITLRVNTLRCTRRELIDRLALHGIGAEETKLSPHGVRLTGFYDIKALYDAADGLFLIEDEASQLAAYALDARAGHTVTDVCAAPGGKTVSVAIGMENKGRIFAFDLHKSKIKLISKAAEAAGVDIVEAAVRDSREVNEDLVGSCDRVLCDVPCSGLGVLSKKPDLRYKDISELDSLYVTQRAILKASAEYVKQGGVLVYSTCTLNERENEDAVREFLKGNSDFTLEYERTLYPHRDGCDGFYIAKMKRSEN